MSRRRFIVGGDAYIAPGVRYSEGKGADAGIGPYKVYVSEKKQGQPSSGLEDTLIFALS